MSKKFNMLELLNNSSGEEKVNKIEKLTEFRTIQININDLIPSEDNFYSTKDISDLKSSIEMFGVQQNLVVKKLGNEKYEIIAGHRRYKALRTLVEEGKKEFQYVPCKVDGNEDSIRDKLLLIITNSTTRELTDYEKTIQAEKLKELLIEYKKEEKLPGRVREIIADILNTSSSQVARMEGISNNLIPEFKEEFKEEKVNVSTAHELSTLPEDEQQVVFEEYKDKGEISLKEVKEKKEELKKKKEVPERGSQEEHLEKPKEEYHEKAKEEVIRFKTTFEILQELSVDEVAYFICSRCNGGNGCAGFCDLAIECKVNNKHEVCVRWLKMKAQKND